MTGVTRTLIEGAPQESVSTPAVTSIGTTAVQVLAANPKRKALIIQNTGTTVIKVLLGTGTPTQTVYHFALSASTGADDGTGGVYMDANWVGPVQIIGSAASGTVNIVEIMTGSPDWNQASDWGSTL